jgi:hypothetical protein
MEINRNPTKRDLLLFGGGLPVATLVLGLVVRHRAGSAVAVRVWMVGAAVSVLYAAIPSIRRPVFVGWTWLTHPIGWAVTQVMLLAAFLVVVLPIGFVLRRVSGDPLRRQSDPALATYWVSRTQPRDVQRYFQRS